MSAGRVHYERLIEIHSARDWPFVFSSTTTYRYVV